MKPILKYDVVSHEVEQTPDAQAQKVNILVVDDLQEKLLVYKTILEDLDQNIILARSGEEALRYVLQNEFAVILLDVNMPGMDGFETASLIRGRKKSSRTPIIFLTAFTDEINIAQGYASGAVDYLPTPVVPEVLKAKIKVFIELFQMRQQAASQAEERALRTAAEEADKKKDEFLAILAHELRNPLAPLRNALHVLQSPQATPDLIQISYQMMEQQLAHLVRLVDDLMDVSRITRGKIELKLENIFLAEAIELAVETVRPLVEERGHKLEVEIPDKSILVKADMVRLSQIFSNLLNNAVKYTNHGGQIKLSINLEKENIIISISDTGVGIPEEKLDKVFDLFMQVDASLTRSQGGLGIGLTLVKKLVELQNGHISVKTEGINKGSTFTVVFPRIKAVAKNITEIKPVSSKIEKKPLYKILIVDDNEAAAQTLGWMLELSGHEINVVTNSQKAIAQAKLLNPHVIFLDIGMPGMSGYEVCEILRKDPAFEKTVIVAQTGWGQAEHRNRSSQAGFNHHLVKPISLQDLSAILDNL